MKPCIALTGGIGCGKSTVSRLFAEHGAGIIDTDVISHQLTACDGSAIPALRTQFGDAYISPDGSLDRPKIRQLIFAHTQERQKLEDILHPLILAETQSQLQRLQAYPYVILVVPLLLTSQEFRKLAQRILVVDCNETTQIRRVIERSQISAEEVRKIIAAQPTRAERLAVADDVIHNDDSLVSLARQVGILHKIYALPANNN